MRGENEAVCCEVEVWRSPYEIPDQVHVDSGHTDAQEFWNELSRLFTMSRTAKATLGASICFTSLIIWAVHYQQQQEHEVSMLKLHLQILLNLLHYRTCIKVSFVTMNVDSKRCESERRIYRPLSKSGSYTKNCSLCNQTESPTLGDRNNSHNGIFVQRITLVLASLSRQ